MFVYRSRTRSDYREVKALAAAGLSDYAIAARLGIPRSTVHNWRHRDSPPHATRTKGDGMPSDASAYAYLLGIYLGDGHVVSGRLEIYLDAEYPGIVAEVERSIATAYPQARIRKDKRPGAIRIIATGPDWDVAFPQHGPGKKHLRPIVLETWQREMTEANATWFLRGLIHSDGCRCLNDFTLTLPSGKTKRYSYPRYFFSNLSDDIRGLFASHCELMGIRWTRSNPRNLSVSHRDSVRLLDSFIGPKS
jgi:hypothetical protein